MVVLSGERVSDLERLPFCRSGDEFLISRHYNLSSDRLFSKRLKYESLVKDATDNLCAALRLSSAAFVEKADYSRKNHGHDYSSIYVYARPLSAISAVSGIKIYPKSVEPIAEFNVLNNGKSNTVTMYSPGQQYDSIDDVPMTGELKFMARKTLSAVDIDSPDFDGWVYPDGSSYSRRDFPAAYVLYGDGQSETFNVPFLSNFIKLNPGVDRIDSMKKVPASNTAIAAHRHEVPKDIMQTSGGKITANIKIPGNSEDDPGIASSQDLLGAIHVVDIVNGKIAETEYEVSNIKYSNISITSGKCSYTEIDRETRPNYNLLPVMIYIGKKAE